MTKPTKQNDLCLLLFIPINKSAKVYCNQVDTSFLCEIQMNSNQFEKGLIYQLAKQSKHRKILNHQTISNNNLLITKLNSCLKDRSNLNNSNETSNDLMKQRRVKINKNLLSSSSPMTTTSNISNRFSLWYNNHKKKNIADGQDYVMRM